MVPPCLARSGTFCGLDLWGLCYGFEVPLYHGLYIFTSFDRVLYGTIAIFSGFITRDSGIVGLRLFGKSDMTLPRMLRRVLGLEIVIGARGKCAHTNKMS